MAKETFGRKPFGGPRGTFKAYSWSPDTSVKKRQKPKGNNPINFCNAIVGGSGANAIDNLTGYVSIKEEVNGIIQNIAYVSCDYVK